MSGDDDSVDKKPAKVVEDKRLTNWSKWQNQWKKVEGTITQKLKVTPGDLVMNYGENICYVKGEKEVLEYAKIPREFDKYRGKPDFYKLPCSLPKRFICSTGRTQGRCCCRSDCLCKNEPTYFAVKTKLEGYIVPSVELVGTPACILEEKNILHGTRDIYKKWQNSKYRERQMYKLCEKIAKIVPHWPKFDNLVVLGSKIVSCQNNDEDIHNVSEEGETDDEYEDSESVSTAAERVSKELVVEIVPKPPRLSLQINGLTFTENCENEGTRKLLLFFEYDIGSHKPCVNFINFKNNGFTTMRISWEKIEKFYLFRNFAEEKCENHEFYFDKRELIILPGCSADLPVWFKTEHSGNYSQFWKLITAPTICNNLQIILFLESYAYYKDFNEKVDTIVKHMEMQARNLLIKDILHEIIEQAKYDEKPVAPNVFGEAELFQLANLSNGRPLFLYHKALVDELQQIYNKVKSEEVNWDYSLSHLKQLVHAKDTNVYLEKKVIELKEKITRIESGKTEQDSVVKGQSSTLLNKEKKSKEKVDKKEKSSKDSKKELKHEQSKSKSNTAQQSDGGIEEAKKEIKIEPYVYSNQMELCDVLRKFDSPVLINSEREKYFACFNVMSAYFSKMCHHLEILEVEKNIVKEQHYPLTKHKLIPLDELPDRLIYEYFENCHIPFHSDDEIYLFEVKRKPFSVRNISSDDVENLHATYFANSIPLKKQESQSKKDGKKEDKHNELKNKESKTKPNKSKELLKGKESSKVISKESEIKKQLSIESFNPYAERFTYISEPADLVVPLISQKTSLPRIVKEDYDYKQYLIVYSCLSDAVKALVDTLQSFECIASYPVLNIMKPEFPNFNDAEITKEND